MKQNMLRKIGVAAATLLVFSACEPNVENGVEGHKKLCAKVYDYTTVSYVWDGDRLARIEYPYEFMGETGVDVEEFYYDGEQLEKTVRCDGDDTTEVRYTWIDGQLQQQKAFRNGMLWGTVDYTYSDGKISTARTSAVYTSEVELHEFTWTGENVTKVAWVFLDGTGAREWLLEYDDKVNPLRMDGGIELIDEYFENNVYRMPWCKNNVVRVQYREREGGYVSTITYRYEYDAEGYPTGMTYVRQEDGYPPEEEVHATFEYCE